MTPIELLRTSILLGLFVLLAGCYGLLYALGRAHEKRSLVAAGFLSYGFQCGIVFAILWFTPLADAWKAFVVMSCFAYFAIPPLTWRYLKLTHRSTEQ